MIQSLHVQNFRNYINEKIDFSPGLNLFLGQNGQGKTNILEAVYYLLTGKSYRVQKENELIRWGTTAFLLEGNFYVFDRPLYLEHRYNGKNKMVKVNGIPYARLSDFIGLINVIFFSPDDLSLVKEGPSERRRFLDSHIVQLKPGYAAILNSYNKIIHQKNSLLKTPMLEKEKINQLELWNEELIHYGSQIIQLRCAFITKLAEAAATVYQHISLAKEEMKISYHPLGFEDAEIALEKFSALLETKMRKEIERQTILVGPHRDDLLILLNQKPSRSFASQGQQRSLVLALKLAQLEIIKQEKGEYPLLLLDDVLSELDIFRRKYLLRFIESANIQTLMTNALENTEIEACSVYFINQGQIRR